MSVRKTVMVLYRICLMIFLAMVVFGLVAEPSYPAWVTWVPVAVSLLLVLAAGHRARAAKADPPPAVEVEAPVSGLWTALNSPADRVPSHGIHTYGQTYAIDIVAERREEPVTADGGPVGSADGGAGSARPKFRVLWPLARRNRDFPAFGAPLLAVADGTVVRASDARRDHLSRNSLPGLVYLMVVEASVRDVVGPRAVVGNHVVLDLGGGTYALYAHLRHGSLRVRVGETVRAGQQLAECGNSGNSTEPHVHFQLMDHPDPDVAIGIPFTWRGIGVPANGRTFTAGRAVTEDGGRDPGADRESVADREARVGRGVDADRGSDAGRGAGPASGAVPDSEGDPVRETGPAQPV
ncbi:M23 family metallopeptidase [Streptomyces sp. NPDC059783]|uniref:M23 family metallopeptidase n=1 Tax=Streptomyces sp. NPDC059783 TaxID=3346944 RepID=UPI0036689808